MTHFTPASFRFLRELAANNERPWFEENRQRYIDDVRTPMQEIIRALNPRLQAISEHYQTDDRLNGGSMFRIYRDVRFSRNKAPYKPWAGARFWHTAGGRGHSPVFYLHVAPKNIFVGAGIWRPESKVLKRLRNFLHHNPNTWLQLMKDLEAAGEFRRGGDQLKRMPRGFDADDPVADDLRYKDFVLSQELTEADAKASDFVDRIAARYQAAAPFVDYLCAALDLDF
ncbi:MAG: TIGR02453 family protein [Pseudomonadota bacterium]